MRARQGAGPAPDRIVVAERLARLRRYRWSSYRAYIGTTVCPPWLCLELAGQRDKRGASQRQEAYRQYVEAAAGEGVDTRGVWKDLKEGALLGGARFIARVRSDVQGDAQEQRAAKRIQTTGDSWEEVVAAAEKMQGEAWPRWRDRYGDRMRDLVMYVGRRRCGLTLQDLADRCGLRNYATAAMALQRYEKRLAQEAAERRRFETLEQMLNVKM